MHKHNKHTFLCTTWSLFFPLFALAESKQKPKEAQKHIEEELQLFPLATQVTMQVVVVVMVGEGGIPLQTHRFLKNKN